jgi:ribonuclease E
VLDNDPNDTNNDAPAAQPEPVAQPDPGAEPGPGAQPDPAPDEPVKKAAKKAAKAPARKTAATKSAGTKTATKSAAKKTTKKAAKTAEPDPNAPDLGADEVAGDTPVDKPKKSTSRKKAAAPESPASEESDDSGQAEAPAAPMVLFKAPEPTTAPPRKSTKKRAATPGDEASGEESEGGQGKSGAKSGQAKSGPKSAQGKANKARAEAADSDDGEHKDSDNKDSDKGRDDTDDTDDGDDEGTGDGARRRRRRGGRRRRKPSDGEGDNGSDDGSDGGSGKGNDQSQDEDSDDSEGGDSEGGSRRRRRRRRSSDDSNGDDSGGSGGGSGNNGQRGRKRNPEDEITSIGGSTRLEAKKQRRREGREAGRRRAPIVSEAEFLARREAVDRVMVIRQKDDLTQIGVLEDKVLVEHYVARESQTSLIGNVYVGRVQNVLPSMEAAFIDIGKGRNAVLYAGEVNWAALGHKDGQQRKIESVLSSGQSILVQVTKDPVGHKGARLTGQVSLPGRFLVYVPDGNTSGISRKLPDTERTRLKTLLKQIVPDSAGVIVRTAAEGASEEELTLDVERLTARWADIEEKVKAGKSPQLLYGEPDLTLKVVRDLFTEDFAKLVVQGDDAWDMVDGYVSHVAPDLRDRLERYDPAESGKDLFASYRVDEQIAKGLDRKVWLPSGGSLIVDRTEAMTVVDVNTGKFTGSGGNLEETVTKNNLEAAEEMVRQLRLRDIGGIIVIDFIDMVLESNRDLVLRRLVECLGRDRTRHQVAEVTSLGLVQMTRKRIGTGLLEAFSTECEHCKGRGLVLHDHPVESGGGKQDDEPRGRRNRGGRNRGRGGSGDDNGDRNGSGGGATVKPSPADLANSRPPEKPADEPETQPETQPATDAQEQPEKSVIGKPASTAPEPQQVPTESGAADDVATPTAATPEPEPATEATPEPVPAPKSAPEEPRLVTSTRRRTARRPAGPPPTPVGAAAATGAAGPVAAGPPPTPSAEPVDIPVEPGAPGHTPVAEPDPRAVEEAATPIHGDPTWPDESERPDGSSEHSDQSEQEKEDDRDSGGVSLTHVPIKRKGSRKR